MAGQKSKTIFDVTHPRRRMSQNFLLLWLDAGIKQSDEDCHETLAKLRNIVNDVHIFTQRDECVDFVTDVNDQKVFLIVEGILGKKILPFIHDIPQLDSIYILCHNKSRHEEWTKIWVKVKGIHTEIMPLCETLQHVVQHLNGDSIAVSFIAADAGASRRNLDQLEPSFMYTKIFKEILLEMQYNEQSIKNFTEYCRKIDCGSPMNINRFEREYRADSSIWWYTAPLFVYSSLNCALRMMEADTIINMGFFIHDLHHQIEQLHQKQVTDYHGKPFIVYRGQGLSTTDFEKLSKTKGGLISFNNFLSTSAYQEISLGFALIASTVPDTVGVLFRMSIDSSISSIPFAAIRENSYYETEEEILFSMHTVFRIGEIKQMDSDNALYRVDLRLTSDDDPQLRTLTERIREETLGSTGWERLGQLLLKIGQLNKAEELYNVLLEQTSNQGEKALYYNQLGNVKKDRGQYDNAIWYYEKSVEINKRTLDSSHPILATLYNNIGAVYDIMGEYPKALSFYEKVLEICQKTLAPNHLSLAASYNNIGGVYLNMGEYSNALSFYEKSLEFRQKTLPSNHPELATSYNNIGEVYRNMGEYPKALSFYDKAFEICQKTLPPNHPSLAASCNNIGGVYLNMGEYLKALSFNEKALEIKQKALPSNHPSLANSYHNIGGVYENMREYSKALSLYQKALEIRQKALPQNHPDLATSYRNIGLVYYNMEQYAKAYSYLERALDIYKRSLPLNHPDIRSVRQCIETVKMKL